MLPRPTLHDHLFGAGPKRILALDGGGVRGVLTLEYLARIEALLRRRAGDDPDFRLSDYFDLIGGTSTGSIIATGLALGLSVSELQQLYRSLAGSIFEKPPYRFGVFVPKFGRAALVAALQRQFGEETLGSARLRTGLMVMTKRLDTGSPWPLHNNPRGRFYEERRGGRGIANKHFPLWQVVRASAAAPHYFEPERIRVAVSDDRFVDGAFVDGGVSPFNNPSLQPLMLATLQGYGLEWPLGPDDLLLVSIGTGGAELQMTADAVAAMPAAEQAGRALAALMTDCDALVQTMLQWLGRSPNGWRIDSEVGDLAADTIGGGKWLSYLRYNALLRAGWLEEHAGLTISEQDATALRAMDNPANLATLAAVGAAAAARQVSDSHFPPAFDLA